MISKYFLIFILFSSIGWVYECMYCSIKEGHWRNCGFLYGPVCPVYGIGVTLTMILFNEILSDTAIGGAKYPAVLIFLICSIGSTVIELFTSLALEYFFHASWWDYSDMPFNYHGRICLIASAGFGIAGILFVKVIFPLMSLIPLPKTHPVYEVLAILFAGVIAADLTLTVESLLQIAKKIEYASELFDEQMEMKVQDIKVKTKELEFTAREKYHLKNMKFKKKEKKHED